MLVITFLAEKFSQFSDINDILMDIYKLCLLLVGLLQQANVTHADQEYFLDDGEFMSSWILGYGKESTTVLKDVVRESQVFVGEWTNMLQETTSDMADATVESFKDGFKGLRSQVRDLHELFTNDDQ